MSKHDPEALFVFCSPCCEDCPTVYPDRGGYVISDPDRPDRGRVWLTSHVLRALVGEQGEGIARALEPRMVLGDSLLRGSLGGVSATIVTVQDVLMVRLSVNEGRLLFLPEEWNALFASAEARKRFATLLRHRAKAHGASATA